MRSTLIGMVVASVILIVAVLPAEYGVDPTGLGRVLGLTQMGEIKVALAREAAADAAADAVVAETPDVAATSVPVEPDTAWRHVTIVTLEPGQGKEVKLVMTKGAGARFNWQAVGGVVNHDTHGDSTGAPNSYVSYRKGSGVSSDSGTLVAAMDGSHGWFWRNRTNRPVAVSLRTSGAYAELKKMY